MLASVNGRLLDPVLTGRTRVPAQGVCHFQTSGLLLQTLLCALPATVLLASGHASLAGYYFWAALGIFLLRGFLTARCDEVLCLLLATAPLINLLRTFAFYNVITATYGLAFLYYAAVAPQQMTTTFKKVPLAAAVFAYTTLFYMLSLINTREYAVNLRLFELAFTIVFVLLLSRNRALLAAALMGLTICAWLVGLAMLPHVRSGSRLGMAQLDGQTLGNPTQLGIPLAFAFLALIVDRGRWLNLESKPMRRWFMLAVTTPLLALTTSRASWLVAVGGIFICMLIGSRQRMKMLAVIAIAAVAIQAVLMSPYGESLRKGLERTFGEKRNVRQRTSGRSDQWKVASYACARSLETLIKGYGPGTSPKVYAAYSPDVPGVRYAVGKKVAFHSLFMQIAVEAGLIGLLFLTLWLSVTFFKLANRTLRHKALFPLICFLSYIFIVITVSGNDINSGIFLGLALAGTNI